LGRPEDDGVQSPDEPVARLQMAGRHTTPSGRRSRALDAGAVGSELVELLAAELVDLEPPVQGAGRKGPKGILRVDEMKEGVLLLVLRAVEAPVLTVEKLLVARGGVAGNAVCAAVRVGPGIDGAVAVTHPVLLLDVLPVGDHVPRSEDAGVENL